MTTFRARNPLRDLLAPSRCVFKLHRPGDAGDPPTTLMARARELDSELTSTPSGAGELLSWSVSHGTVDAFGGLFVLAESGAFERVRRAPPERTGLAAGFPYWHWARQAKPGQHQRSFTQRAFEQVLISLRGGVHEPLGLAVAQDNPRDIDATSFRGNSLVVVPYALEQLLELCQGPQAAWLSSVRRGAERVAAIALRSPARLRPCSLILSSVGNLGRISWAKNITPESFEMIPTPATPAGATVVLWGQGPEQALTLCAADAHVVAEQRERIAQGWESALG